METSAVVTETSEQLEIRLRKEVREALEPTIRIEYEGKLDVWKATELAKLEEKQTTDIETLVQKYMEKQAEAAKPPSEEDLKKLLDQDYLEFPVKIQQDGQSKTLTIKELPMEVEQIFYRQFKARILDKLTDVAALVQASMDQPMDQKIQNFLEAFDGAFNVLADACTLILNHDGSHQGIDQVWCKKNLSSMRMWNIVQAQMQVNRLRDFFSQVFRSGKQMEMIVQRPSIQLLRQQLPR